MRMLLFVMGMLIESSLSTALSTALDPQDANIKHKEPPVHFNCAAKYVDFNGGWVVDIVSLNQPHSSSSLRRDPRAPHCDA